MNSSKTLDTLFGIVTPTVAVAASFQDQLEYWLRISSLMLGILVATVSLYRLLFKYRK